MATDSIIVSTLDDVRVITEGTLEELIRKWNSMYTLSDEIKAQRFNQFLTHLKDFYEEMLSSEESRKTFYTKEVEKKLKECNDLEKALNVTINVDIDCTLEPLTEVIKHLDNSLKSFDEIKKQRMTKYESLKLKEKGLCSVLGLKELFISNAIPSMQDLERLEQHIFIMDEEKIKRTEQFYSHRDIIVTYIQKLEVSILLDFEKTLVESDLVGSLTLEDLEHLQGLETNYKKQFESAKVKVEFMIDGLKKLWDRLDVCEDYRANFIEKHSGVGRKTMDSIQSEIVRCEKLKKELIEPLIKKTKVQISEMFENLCYSEEQRSKHSSHDNDRCSEALLDVLEMELATLECIFNENHEILEMARKQQNMWDRMLELEEAAKDKARLFNNRGGQLLREEKERKTIEQTLPKLNKKLEDLLTQYESDKGTPFLYYGENLLEKLRCDVQERAAYKQNKVVKKGDGKHLVDSTSDAREKRKLNLMLTPKSEMGKRMKLASSTSSLASSASKGSSKNTDGRSRTRIALFKDQDTSVASSYSIFQEEIEKKRSTTTSPKSGRKPLKEVNSPMPIFHSSPSQEMKTPRFEFRPRTTQFNAKTAVSSSSKWHTPASTPGQTRKINTATPRTVTKSTNRLATPKSFVQAPNLRSATPNRTNTTRPKHFFGTPASSNKNIQNSLSIIKPAKFNFEF